MSKNFKIVSLTAIPIFLAILVLFADHLLFSNSELAYNNYLYQLSNTVNESGVSFGSCNPCNETHGIDLGGETFVSEILRHFALFLYFATATIPFFINRLEKPIERIELNLTK